MVGAHISFTGPLNQQCLSPNNSNNDDDDDDDDKYNNNNLYDAVTQSSMLGVRRPPESINSRVELRSLPREFSSLFYSLLKTFLFARAWAGSASE